MRTPFVSFLLLVLMFGCLRSGLPDHAATGTNSGSTSHATRFDIQAAEDYTILKVYNPWQKSEGTTYTYILGDNQEEVPDSLSGFPFITTPVSRVVTMSTTHVAMIAELGESGSIKGASGTSFIYNADIRLSCEKGLTADVGYGQGLNYELLVDLEPDVVFLYGVEGNVTSTAEKLTELGLTVVYCAEYLEPDPLGKAEWIRFFAPFYKKETEADRFFNRVDSAYMALCSLTDSLSDKPKILTGLPWKDTWYVAGGKSFAARLISDAGGLYLWNDDVSDEAIPLDLESVFSRAILADTWINPGVAFSLDELLKFDERFSALPALSTGSVYNNNARISPEGGNDYWESATTRPDLILADLITVFHPHLMGDHSLVYYKKLN